MAFSLFNAVLLDAAVVICWPGALGIAGLLICALLFFPLKGIGQRPQADEPIGDVWESAQAEIVNVLRGDHPDQMILDQFASALTLADAHGKLYFDMRSSNRRADVAVSGL